MSGIEDLFFQEALPSQGLLARIRVQPRVPAFKILRELAFTAQQPATLWRNIFSPGEYYSNTEPCTLYPGASAIHGNATIAFNIFFAEGHYEKHDHSQFRCSFETAFVTSSTEWTLLILSNRLKVTKHPTGALVSTVSRSNHGTLQVKFPGLQPQRLLVSIATASQIKPECSFCMLHALLPVADFVGGDGSSFDEKQQMAQLVRRVCVQRRSAELVTLLPGLGPDLEKSSFAQLWSIFSSTSAGNGVCQSAIARFEFTLSLNFMVCPGFEACAAPSES
jgi:hypothetical protein